jgi:phosphohistidine phosphatase
MKTLILVRHAKSDWPINTDDLDRPLSERGHQDAPKMAKFLKSNEVKIDVFVTSPAKRTITTCRYFAEVFENKNIKKIEELYNASSTEFLEVIENLDNSIENVALFSHNNGITYFANALTNENIEHMPTCSVVSIKIDTENWAEFKKAPKEFLYFHKPKEI